MFFLISLRPNTWTSWMLNTCSCAQRHSGLTAGVWKWKGVKQNEDFKNDSFQCKTVMEAKRINRLLWFLYQIKNNLQAKHWKWGEMSQTQTLWRTISENRRNVPVSPAFDRQLVQCHIPPFLCHSLLYMLHFTDAWLHKYSLRRCKSRMLPRNYWERCNGTM